MGFCRQPPDGRTFGKRWMCRRIGSCKLGTTCIRSSSQGRVYFMTRVCRNLKIARQVYTHPRPFPNDKGRKLIEKSIEYLHRFLGHLLRNSVPDRDRGVVAEVRGSVSDLRQSAD